MSVTPNCHPLLSVSLWHLINDVQIVKVSGRGKPSSINQRQRNLFQDIYIDIYIFRDWISVQPLGIGPLIEPIFSL